MQARLGIVVLAREAEVVDDGGGGMDMVIFTRGPVELLEKRQQFFLLARQ